MLKSRLPKLGLIVLIITLLSSPFAFAHGGGKVPVNFTGTILDTAFPGQVPTTGTGWGLGRTSDNKGVILSQTITGTWNIAQNTDKDLLNSIVMSDTNSGWAVGDGGKIYQYKSSNHTWNKVSSPTKKNLNRVRLGSSGYVFAVGADGTVLLWWPPSNEWIAYPGTPLNTTNDLYGGSVVGDTTSWTGYVVGENNAAYKCVCNAYSQTWSQINTGLTANYTFKDIHMSSVGNGYVVTSNGTVISITNDVWAVVPGINVGNGVAVIDFGNGTSAHNASQPWFGNFGFTSKSNSLVMSDPLTSTQVMVLGTNPVSGYSSVAIMDRGGAWGTQAVSPSKMTYMEPDTTGMIWTSGSNGTLIVMDRGGAWGTQ